MTREFVDRLMRQFRERVIVGESWPDPGEMLRQRCRYCANCGGRGCPDVMRWLPEFEHHLRVERFVWQYMRGLGRLARDSRSPDMQWINELAASEGVMDIVDDCLNAAAEEEVRVRKLIPPAVIGDEGARNELLTSTYLWFRPELNKELHGGNWQTLDGRVSSSSLMGRWADRFLKSVGNFNMTMRPIFTNQDGQRIVRAQPFPPEQLVGNFLNFARARMQHVLLEAVRSIRNDDRRFTGLDANLEFEEGGPTPSDIAADEESRAIAITSVTQALRVTPEPHRTVVQMIYFEGKSLKEVADRLDRTIDSVKHLHATAKKLVKQLITTQD